MRFKGMFDAAIRIPKEAGVGAFWQGNGANCIRIIPNAALKFAFNDALKVCNYPQASIIDSLPLQPRLQGILVKKGVKYDPTEKFARKVAAGGLYWYPNS